ncbi:hypothetical protein NDR87_02890 [Nocardia sp. CDC159]|uniref:Uncharacterized protein n=1 Tax=Nocardia pulmonis TaxID=2951408 RepID=A0A9X2E1S9_9NOCA|nr:MULTISPECIES: hypothetical protein [Nocardia]MCM6772041.1 hypothetical protein [Nocardia pulmonis]MCM6785301.1 hypothetical protein [Nocardia sp. CDC159]
MTATPDDLRKRATRLRRGVGQLGVLEAIIDAAYGPWLGVMDADGRGTAELRMHLAGQYRITAVVTSAGKLSLVQLTDPDTERVLSAKPSLRQGWTDTDRMPKQPDWIEYVVSWVENASTHVDRRAVLAWRLAGADRRLAAMDETIENLRASLLEREQLRTTLAAEVAELRAELESLPAAPAPSEDPVTFPTDAAAPAPADVLTPDPPDPAPPIPAADTSSPDTINQTAFLETTQVIL